ncbi:phosphonate ABC transporter, permease protein PhnE, partial [Klebsiella pneumoniae]|nr:phosphonate ABC transporter, permease protein PhnE [Klebsiella pneumoniae]
RSAAVLGFVGAGGIWHDRASDVWGRSGDVGVCIILLLVAVVMIMDTLSAWLRRRYIGGAAVPLYQGGR